MEKILLENNLMEKYLLENNLMEKILLENNLTEKSLLENNLMEKSLLEWEILEKNFWEIFFVLKENFGGLKRFTDSISEFGKKKTKFSYQVKKST